jgi:hypothetical protein
MPGFINFEEFFEKDSLSTLKTISEARIAYEGFCEDLARQNTVASVPAPATVSASSHMYGFLCCRIWVSVVAVVS